MKRKYLQYFPWGLFPSSEINFCDVYHQRSMGGEKSMQVQTIRLFFQVYIFLVISAPKMGLRLMIPRSGGHTLPTEPAGDPKWSYSQCMSVQAPSFPKEGEMPLQTRCLPSTHRDRLSTCSRKEKKEGILRRETEISNSLLPSQSRFPQNFNIFCEILRT